ncbi:hypothetical protein B0H13DRAFT_1920973 [Mycena leptocephala]|nr:hypothetical protein B0H13DRAFT_1920973 [Mycena leptocephala]
MACKPKCRAWAGDATKIHAHARNKPIGAGASHFCKPKNELSVPCLSQTSMITGRVSDILIENNLTVIIVLELFQVLSVRDEHYGMPVLVRRDGEKIFTIILAEQNVKQLENVYGCRNGWSRTTPRSSSYMSGWTAIVNSHAFHNAHLLCAAFPDLLAPIPLFEDWKAKHDEFASTLRDTRADKQDKKKAASETTAKKGRGRKRKTAPVPEPDRDEEDNTDAARSSQPRSRKRARTTAPAEPSEELDGEGLVDNLVAGRVKRLRESVRAARTKMV